ncbi:ribonuclease III [Heliorestis convoluta]|uniref:Ribonuclease 3 n=1 Tax=Heliorestis convoluta TaxID=356322 RepID=A0A5Q2N777_9FIRM|nr:ribonuclease III [Heliorestis convoluta]QGG48120.1 ribonuclease III [Heliorestis convoluta]
MKNRGKKCSGSWPTELATMAGIEIKQRKLLDMALTHPSYVYENNRLPQEHNQRLEFLGDAVLGLVVAEQLYNQYPKWSEGELSRHRAAIVCEANLAEGARRVGLGNWLKLGKGEEGSGGRDRTSSLADALEALIGASYLAGGIEAARALVLNLFGEKLEKMPEKTGIDHKTTLQELVQKNGQTDISYRILEESGPDHDKLFMAGVYLNGSLVASGQGRTKKEAEQKAAGQALPKIQRNHEALS